MVRRTAALAVSDVYKEQVMNRMKVYEELTAPVLNYYKTRADVIEIIATGTPDSVFEELTQAIETGN
mgnify:CR=1 FL=1